MKKILCFFLLALALPAFAQQAVINNSPDHAAIYYPNFNIKDPEDSSKRAELISSNGTILMPTIWRTFYGWRVQAGFNGFYTMDSGFNCWSSTGVQSWIKSAGSEAIIVFTPYSSDYGADTSDFGSSWAMGTGAYSIGSKRWALFNRGRGATPVILADYSTGTMQVQVNANLQTVGSAHVNGNATVSGSLTLGSGTVFLSGAGSPEGVVSTGNSAALYIDATATSTASVLYIRPAGLGVGNTGWLPK